jgi:putative redox protein
MVEAKTKWIEQHQFIGEASNGHALVVDGDRNSGNSPMELVLIGLCGCTGYDVASILTKKREPYTSLEVRAEAERAPQPPTVYTRIKLIYTVRGKVSRKSVEDAIHLSKSKYCSVSAMLEKTAEISWELDLQEG